MTRSLFVPVTIVLACTPAFSEKVSTDFDPDYDFSAAETPSWGEGSAVAGNELSRERPETAIIDARQAQIGSAPNRALGNFPPMS